MKGQYITAKKNPAWEAGYTGYCCCREIGSYFSGEAVLDFFYCYKSATSTSTYSFSSYLRLLASMSFQMSMATACKNLFCAPVIQSKSRATYTKNQIKQGLKLFYWRRLARLI